MWILEKRQDVSFSKMDFPEEIAFNHLVRAN